ncbi:hypothetical protein ACVIJW_005554 [Bradyrhizobium barranii subsp. barranii]
MSDPVIRPARADEYDEIGRVWMESWVSTGLAEASEFLLANLRARIRRETENGWSLFVADDSGTIAAMLALHLPKLYLDMLFVGQPTRGNRSDGNCSPSPARKCRMKCTCAASVRTKKPGAGTSAKALCSRRKRSSRRMGS